MRRSKNKNIDILTYKHGLLSIDMKTKVIQHVESENERLKEFCKTFLVPSFSDIQTFL